MRFSNVFIEAVDYVLPGNVVSSEQIEKRLAPVYERLKLPFGRLELMTGISERRFWDPGTPPSEGSIAAGRKALQSASFDPEELGCLVHAAVCRDFMEPATASVVHEALGLGADSLLFDVSNACLGVVNAMICVANMIETGQITSGLIVCSETAEELHQATINRILTSDSITRKSFKKHFASLTIGSGAASILLADDTHARSGHRLLGGTFMSDTSSNALCREDKDAPPSDDGPLMATEAEALLHAGCDLAEKTWRKTCDALQWDNSTPDRIFTHQVGSAHKKLLFEQLGLDPARDYPTVHFLGNTGSAALPVSFAMGVEKKLLKTDDRAALLGIGSGLSSIMLGVKW